MIVVFLQRLATSKIVQWIGLALAVIVAYFGVRAKHKAEGREEIRTEAVTRSLEDVRHAQEVDRTVRTSDPHVELRRWTRPDSQ
jgi:hypothetical protein